MNTHEKASRGLPNLHIGLEGYLRTDDLEFLESLRALLLENGFHPEGLLFSGFDGNKVAGGQSLPRLPYIFGMNEAGWREALRIGEPNPAQYAEGLANPCIGVYDATQLREIYSSVIEQSQDLTRRIKLESIVPGDALEDMDPAQPVAEAVIHKDYPEGSPTDALVGLVFIEGAE